MSRQNERVPKRVAVSIPTPGDVAVAIEAFGTELRVHLIRYFAQHPDARQADAVRALAVDRAVVSFNVNALADLGVLRTVSDRRYRVDAKLCRSLGAALADFVSPI